MQKEKRRRRDQSDIRNFLNIDYSLPTCLYLTPNLVLNKLDLTSFVIDTYIQYIYLTFELNNSESFDEVILFFVNKCSKHIIQLSKKKTKATKKMMMKKKNAPAAVKPEEPRKDN